MRGKGGLIHQCQSDLGNENVRFCKYRSMKFYFFLTIRLNLWTVASDPKFFYTKSDKKYCENLMDVNEARLHEATLNFHTQAWMFSCLSMSSVDSKQQLSEAVFMALVEFLLYPTSTHHRVNQLPKNTTGVSSITYVILCGARDRNCYQQAIGASIRTIFRTFFAHDSDFWRKTRLLWVSLISCDFCLFPPEGRILF